VGGKGLAILEKEVWVGLSSNQINYYINLGYELPKRKNKYGKITVPRGSKILVKLEHLSKKSNTIVTKICDECGKKLRQRYNAIIVSRENNGNGLDYCKVCGHKIGINNLLRNIPFERSVAHIAPHLISEWNYEKNEEIPKEIYAGSHKKIWWTCPNCNSSYEMTAYWRTNGGNCTYCSGQKVNHTNSLATARPELVKEWHPTKNGELTPHDVTPFTTKKAWWICLNCSHEYHASISHRSHGTSCPRCNESKGEKKINEVLVLYDIQFDRQYKLDNCRKMLPLPFDFYLNKLILVEFDGEQHFKLRKFSKDKKKMQESFAGIKQRDQIKNSYCIENNIPLVRIPYWEYDNVECILENVLGYYNLLEKKNIDKELVHKFLVNNPSWSYERYIKQANYIN
jgi:very-short-patch-repair endonuclease